MDYVTPEVANKINFCLEQLRSGDKSDCPHDYYLRSFLNHRDSCDDCTACWHSACLDYIRENAPKDYKDGDSVICFERPDESRSFCTPEPGTIGVAVGGHMIQWPAGATKFNSRWMAEGRVRRISNLTKSKEEINVENYIVLNGKKAELTEEQLEKLGIKQDKPSVFARQDPGDDDCDYLSIDMNGDVLATEESGSRTDDEMFSVANYVRDCPEGEKLLEQRALHEILSRQLWRFAMENGGSGEHFIVQTGLGSLFEDTYDEHKKKPFGNGFCSRETAQRAIDEIVKPFLAEHPEFEW
jgi:hypothetical protein